MSPFRSKAPLLSRLHDRHRHKYRAEQPAAHVQRAHCQGRGSSHPLSRSAAHLCAAVLAECAAPRRHGCRAALDTRHHDGSLRAHNAECARRCRHGDGLSARQIRSRGGRFMIEVEIRHPVQREDTSLPPASVFGTTARLKRQGFGNGSSLCAYRSTTAADSSSR